VLKIWTTTIQNYTQLITNSSLVSEVKAYCWQHITWSTIAAINGLDNWTGRHLTAPVRSASLHPVGILLLISSHTEGRRPSI